MKHIDIDIGFTYATSQIASDTTIVAGENEATEVIATYHENLLADIGGEYEEWCDIEYVDPSTKKMVKNVVELDGNHSFVLTDIITYGQRFSLQFWARCGETEYRDSNIFSFKALPSISAVPNELLPGGTIYQTMILPIFDSKVDKVAGKGLSTNDYSNGEKEKLAGIGAGDVLTVTREEKDKIAEIDTINMQLDDFEEKIFEKNIIEAVLSQEVRQLGRSVADLEGEVQTVSLTNTQSYPFNNSIKTIVLAKNRDTLNYRVIAEVQSATGGFAGNVKITDKALNGFKIAYDGSAAAATIKIWIEGGMYQ